jgi:two-component system, OmpR family, alkaline phosphatase synthesis response regulator PhoP
MIEPIPTQTSNDLPSDSSHLIVVGQLSINLLIGCVQSNNRSIRLTMHEFKLLTHLARKAGHVVPKEDLLQEVWGYCVGTGGMPAQVKNLVRRLRQKIEPDPENPRYLVTIYGYGYMVPIQPEDGSEV